MDKLKTFILQKLRNIFGIHSPAKEWMDVPQTKPYTNFDKIKDCLTIDTLVKALVKTSHCYSCVFYSECEVKCERNCEGMWWQWLQSEVEG